MKLKKKKKNILVTILKNFTVFSLFLVKTITITSPVMGVQALLHDHGYTSVKEGGDQVYMFLFVLKKKIFYDPN